MIDTSDGSVWTDIFSSDENWNEYKSKTIFRLYSKDNLYGRNKNIKPDAINSLIKARSYKYPSTDDMPSDILEIYCKHHL